MKTRYKFIHFVEIEVRNKSYHAYECRNNKSGMTLGWVSYYVPWNQNVFTAEKNWPIFNDSCLDDISHFLKQLNEEKK